MDLIRMNKTVAFLGLVLVLSLTQCKKSSSNPEEIKETSVAGSTTILVDETIFPVIEDLAVVFESEYKRAKIKLVSLPESEIVQQIKTDKARIAILARDLDTVEVAFYNARQINPRRTEFAVDGLAVITNKTAKDSVVTAANIRAILSGAATNKFTTMVVDNSQSSTVRNLKELTGVATFSNQRVFSLKSNKEVVKYVTENEGALGIIGVNWLLQPSDDLVPYLDKLKVLGVENVKLNAKNKFVKPNQTNIADGSYPYTRKLFLLNFQGTAGLGMGFASYIAGDKGQRIILKSGLVPTRFPSREIAVRNEVENK